MSSLTLGDTISWAGILDFTKSRKPAEEPHLSLCFLSVDSL